MKLYLLCAPDGTPVNWCLAHPGLGERDVAQALPGDCRSPIERGRIILCDKGLAGRAFQRLVRGLGMAVVRPDRTDEPRRSARWRACGSGSSRSSTPSKGQLSVEQHGGRCLAGVFVRVAQRLLALAAGVWFNWLLGQPDKRSLVAYDH